MVASKDIQLPNKWAFSIIVAGIATLLLVLVALLLVPSRAGAQNMTFSLVEPFPELIVSGGGSTASKPKAISGAIVREGDRASYCSEVSNCGEPIFPVLTRLAREAYR